MGLIAKSNSNDDFKGFDTYNFYLESILNNIHELYEEPEHFCLTILNKTKKLRELSNFDSNWVEKYLKLSWNTEFLLNQNSDDTDILRFNNHWTPIQCYYSIYSCLEVLSYLLDQNKAGSHHKALKKGTNYFVKSGISPWNLAFIGARGKSRHEHRPKNFPKNIEFPSNLQRQDVKPVAMIGTCLRAEHNHRIDTMYDKKSGKYKYEFDPGYTGILHFLYRLRLKSNYEDIDLFISDAPDEDIKKFSDSLCYINFWSLMYMEIVIIRKSSLKYFSKAAKDYLKLNPSATDLDFRLDVYKRIF